MISQDISGKELWELIHKYAVVFSEWRHRTYQGGEFGPYSHRQAYRAMSNERVQQELDQIKGTLYSLLNIEPEPFSMPPDDIIEQIAINAWSGGDPKKVMLWGSINQESRDHYMKMVRIAIEQFLSFATFPR